MSTVTATSQPAIASPLRRLITGHPLVAYFVIAFAGTWLTSLPVILARNGFGLLPFTFPFIGIFGINMLATFTGPTLAAFIVTATTSGKAGVRQFLRRYVQWRVGAHWYLIVFLGYPIVSLLALSILLGATPLTAIIQKWSLLFTLYLPLILTYNLIDAVGEEPGWRGFALPRLQQQYGALRGSLVLGVFHSLWHLPGFFVIGWLGPFTLSDYGVFVLTAMAGTIFWTWIFNNTKGSILIAILLHSASNANNTLIGKLLPVPSPVVFQEGTLLIYGAYVLCALLVIAFTKGRLSYKPERLAQPAAAALMVESTERL